MMIPLAINAMPIHNFSCQSAIILIMPKAKPKIPSTIKKRFQTPWNILHKNHLY